jgi:hypothetical protein
LLPLSGLLFLIVGLMKGHVGGGSTSDGFRASVMWLSNMPFHGFPPKQGFGQAGV